MIDTTQLDNYIITLAEIRDKEINKILKKQLQKAGNKANNEVKRMARRTAKSKNNVRGEKSYLSTYKRGKAMNRGKGNWTIRVFNKNKKAIFLERESFHHNPRRSGIAATQKARNPAREAFIKYMNNAIDDIIKELSK